MVVDVKFGLTVKFKVATESQPATVINVTEYVPAIVYVLPFHEYGSAFWQIVSLVVEVKFGFTVTNVVHSDVLPHSSDIVHFTLETPILKIPEALLPDPLLIVTPVIWYVMLIEDVPVQLSDVKSRGIL